MALETKSANLARAREHVKAAPETSERDQKSFPIVGVGASAGGLEAFKQLLSALPEKPGMAFVLIPHLDPTHTSVMQELLSAITRLPVVTVKNGTRVEVDHAYVIPPNAEMTIANGVLHLATRQRGELAMPIDTFLRSLAEDQPTNAIGIILSGTANDGSLGITAIKGEGGITFAQDSKSAKYDDMPRNAVATGCVDFVLSPADIVAELSRIRKHPYVTKTASVAAEGLAGGTSYGFSRLFKIVKEAYRVDFSGYKYATIHRRILRRMALRKIDKIKDYVRRLEQHPEEVEALYQDFLINVTSFFRNPEAFDALRHLAYPVLFKDRAATDPMRIWVPGCSTGEEVYSHAICLLEYLTERRADCSLQIFGTDVNESAVKKARIGIYKENISADVSPVRLRRFFHKVDQGYQISKSVRDLCIFARQNVLTDAPFSKMDIVSCRNLLIYLGPEQQKKLIPTLHYSLKPKGYLMLGVTEGLLGSGAELFDVADAKSRIYIKKQVASPVVFGMVVEGLKPGTDHGSAGTLKPALAMPTIETALKKADSLLLAKYVPPAIVVDENLDIVQTRGHAGKYLRLPPGKASLNLLRMSMPGLVFELQKAIEAARKSSRPFMTEQLHVEADGSSGAVNLEVSPFNTERDGSPMYLIVFNEPVPVDRKPRKRQKRKAVAEPPKPGTGDEERLRAELAAAREQMQSILEHAEASNEQLQSANEEIQSANEELQSTNEELQTSKEELESGNEELKTVNEELQHRNQQLTHFANDLANLLNSVNIPIVMLGPDLKVTRFTPQAGKVFGLSANDVGRPIGSIKLKMETAKLEQKALEVIREIVPQNFSSRDSAGVAYLIHAIPYRTSDNKIEGVVFTVPGPASEK